MTKDKPAVGFIGLGLMGAAMTRRLMEQGYAVIGYDVAAEKTSAAAAAGLRAATSPAAVASESDIVLLCVTGTAAVEAAVFGAGGIREAAGRGTVLVDHSTTDTGATRRMAERLQKEAGTAWVDAPVSGGPPAAAAGKLAVMAGGEAEAVARIEPVMAVLAGHFTHMGPVGAGQATKMINQVLVLNNFCVLAEAVKLAENAGIDAGKIPECLGDGYAGSNMLRAFFARMIRREFEPPAGYARQVLKDLDMVYDLAKQTTSPTPMTDQARMLYRMLIAHGDGGLDAIAVLKLYDKDPE